MDILGQLRFGRLSIFAGSTARTLRRVRLVVRVAVGAVPAADKHTQYITLIVREYSYVSCSAVPPTSRVTTTI